MLILEKPLGPPLGNIPAKLKSPEVRAALKRQAEDKVKSFKRAMSQKDLKASFGGSRPQLAHDMSSQQRANLIEAIMQQVLGE